MRLRSREYPEDTAGSVLAVLAIGIDNLGVLEELFGEDLGEEVLAVLHRRLAGALPAGAWLGTTRYRRLLLGMQGMDEATVTALFERLQRTAARPVPTSGGPVAVTISGGCAVAACGAPAGALERRALQALHGAMANGVGSFAVAGDEDAALEYRTRLVDVARAASARPADAAEDNKPVDRLAVAYQPVVCASGGHTIAFHECLARLRRPDGTTATAGAFMPALERLGLASAVDRQVLAAALDTLARHPKARLSVNIFPQTMQDAAWTAMLERAATRDPGLPERLIVEITETCSMLDPRRTLGFMDRLRRHGVAFALDDFGAGNTSFRYLRDFRFDMVKLDGGFVRGIRPGSDNAFLVDKLVEVARRFDMMTVAEWVQGPAEARCLSDLGIEYFQGFWFGSPSLFLRPTPSPMPGVAAQA